MPTPATVRAFGWAAGLAMAPALGCAALAAPPQPSLEAAVKATYLYKLGAFIDWPASAFDGPAAPLRLCVAGDDPFGALLDQAVRGQSITGRPISVTRVDRVARGVACQILFIAGSGSQPVAEALAEVRGSPVLTVTDGAQDPAARGIVDFVVKDNRVRFLIDAAAAGQAELAISSKLLSLSLRAER